MKTFHPIQDKEVNIVFQSKALGDTLAWFPYVEQFRIENKCDVNLFLPLQELIPILKPNYPEIVFLKEDDYIIRGRDGLYFKMSMDAKSIMSYKIGARWDGRQHLPLQQSASEILGLPFKETRPNLHFKNYGRPIKEKYVAIGVHAAGPQLKYWNYPNGWDYVVKYLKHKGYKVLAVDLHEDRSRDGYVNKTPDGVEKRNGEPLDITMNNIIHSEFFIGLSSGLSWLSWALNKWVIMINGVSEPWCEFQHKCIHVFNHSDDVCTGCYHRDETLNLKGEWDVCPDHKGTDRQFECTKEIEPPMIFSAIDKVLSTIY